MEMVPLTAERKAELENYAERLGEDTATALDHALGTYLEWERLDFEEGLAGIRQGLEDVNAGRTRPAADFFAELRRKHGFSG